MYSKKVTISCYAIVFISIIANIVQYRNGVVGKNKEILYAQCNEFTKKNNITYDCDNTSFSCYNHLSVSKLKSGGDYYCITAHNDNNRSGSNWYHFSGGSYNVSTSSSKDNDDAVFIIMIISVIIMLIGFIWYINSLHKQLTEYHETDAIVDFNTTAINCVRHYHDPLKLVCNNDINVFMLSDLS